MWTLAVAPFSPQYGPIGPALADAWQGISALSETPQIGIQDLAFVQLNAEAIEQH